MKNIGFDNDTSENTFSCRYIIYIANERLERKKQFHCKDYLLETPRSNAKMQFEECTTKTELCNGKEKLCTRL